MDIRDNEAAREGYGACRYARDVTTMSATSPVGSMTVKATWTDLTDAADVQAIVVKHPIGWRVGLGEMAANALYVDLPGASSPRLARLPFHRVPRPMYPLDDDAQVEAAIRRSMAPAS